MRLKPEPSIQGFLTRLADPLKDRSISGTIVDFYDTTLHHEIEWDEPIVGQIRFTIPIGELWDKAVPSRQRSYKFDWERKALERATAEWQCEVDGKKWANFDASISDKLEAAHTNRAAVTWMRGKFEYRVDWEFMVQVNTTTNKHRSIRREFVVSSRYGRGAAASEHAEGEEWLAYGKLLGEGRTTCHTVLAPTPGSKQEASKDLNEFNFGGLDT